MEIDLSFHELLYLSIKTDAANVLRYWKNNIMQSITWTYFWDFIRSVVTLEMTVTEPIFGYTLYLVITFLVFFRALVVCKLNHDPILYSVQLINCTKVVKHGCSYMMVVIKLIIRMDLLIGCQNLKLACMPSISYRKSIRIKYSVNLSMGSCFFSKQWLTYCRS